MTNSIRSLIVIMSKLTGTLLNGGIIESDIRRVSYVRRIGLDYDPIEWKPVEACIDRYVVQLITTLKKSDVSATEIMKKVSLILGL